MFERQNFYMVTICILIIVFTCFFTAHTALAEPVGPVLIYNRTEEATPKSALMLNTSGGTVTTLRLNATSQNIGWKAYVGNISGKLVLQDADNFSVFEWDISTVAGEIYATKSSTAINWDDIVCADSTVVATEDSAFNKATTDDDSITNTFVNITHDEFYVGTKYFAANKCNFTTATYVANQPQYSNFQEIILYDGSSAVYVSLLENSTVGYNNRHFDFQIILPEDKTTMSNTAYYFYVELD